MTSNLLPSPSSSHAWMQADGKASGDVPGVFESKATESNGKPNDGALPAANETEVAKQDLKASNIAALANTGDGGFEKQTLVLSSGCGELKASDAEQGYQEAVHYANRRLNRRCGKPNSRWDFGMDKKRITGMREADKLESEGLGKQTSTTMLPMSPSRTRVHQVNRLYRKHIRRKSGMDPRIVARILEVLPEGMASSSGEPAAALELTTMTPARLASLESTTPQPSSRGRRARDQASAAAKLMTGSLSPKMPQGKPVPEATPQLRVRKTDFLSVRSWCCSSRSAEACVSW